MIMMILFLFSGFCRFVTTNDDVSYVINHEVMNFNYTYISLVLNLLCKPLILYDKTHQVSSLNFVTYFRLFIQR
jgi:hypothetical protein